MSVMVFLLIAAVAGLLFWYWSWRRRQEERERVSEERMANVMVQAMSTRAKPAQPADPVAVAQQKLLYEAATKAGEAGEAVLAIQLYARLIARYPQSELGAQARAAVEAQKKKLVKR